MRRLASLCLAAVTLTPVAVALPPLLLSPAAADAAPRPVAPRVTATAFSGIDAGARSAALAAPQSASGSATTRLAALTAPLSRPRFGAVGVTWTGGTPAGTTVQVRLREKGVWSDWRVLPPGDGGGADPGTAEARSARAGTDPLLTDGADGVQVRVSSRTGQAPAGMKVQTVDPGASAADGAPALVRPATALGAGALPTIITRAQWGADESLRRCAPVYLPGIKAAVLHHTAGSNSYTVAGAAAEIRSDYAYHTQVMGWCDLGYNFVVDRFGRIYEGRAGGVDRLVQGAHAIGVNGETFGVAALGNFDVAQPPAVMLSAITRLVAWKLGLSHIDPRAATTLTSAGNTKYAAGTPIPVYGLTSHRDTWYTACPGQYLYAKMAYLRGAVAAAMTQSSVPPASKPTGRYAAYDKVVLQVGSKGSAVKVLQAALKISPADGDFGPQTRAKVVAYQKAKHLSATGVVTSVVWRALSADADRPTGKYASYDKVVLQVGSKGSAVKVLQAALRITPADGDFGPQTRAKVVAYQKAKHLSATGVVTSPVWRALSADADRPTGKYAAYDKVVLKVGSKGSAVTVLQKALRITPADGAFGPQTRAKVVAYQKAKHLSATGVVTSPVWRALSADAARASTAVSRSLARTAPVVSRSMARTAVLPKAAAPTGTYAAYDKVVLKVGSRGAAVKVLQSALWVSPVDGDFGPQTKATVVAYQKARKLSADGVVSSAVWRALSADATHPTAPPAASFTLSGSGFGHGVGMSQYGAYAQALQGRTLDQILRSYYPGTTRTSISGGTLLRVNLLNRTPAVTLRVAATTTAPGTVSGRVAGATKVVTFTAGDTVVVRPNTKNGQDVLLGGKVVASAAAGKALRVTWTGTRAWAGPAATVQVTGTGHYRSHSGQAYRYGEMAISRTGTALNLVNVLRLGDEYVRGVPESPFYWGPYGGAALQAQAMAARTFAYTAYRAGVSAGCDCHVYDGTMSQTYDGYRVDQDPNARYWASAIAATNGSVITYQGRPINATYYSGSGGRTMDVRDVWGASVPYLRSVADPWSLLRTVAGHPVGNGNVSWTVTVSQAAMSHAVGLSGLRSVQITRRTTGGSPAELTATSVTGAKVTKAFATSEQLRRTFGLKAPWVGSITAH